MYNCSSSEIKYWIDFTEFLFVFEDVGTKTFMISAGAGNSSRHEHQENPLRAAGQGERAGVLPALVAPEEQPQREVLPGRQTRHERRLLGPDRLCQQKEMPVPHPRTRHQELPTKIRFELSYIHFMARALQTSKVLFMNTTFETDFKKIALVSLIKKDISCYVFHAYDPKNSRFLVVKILKKVLVNSSGGPPVGTRPKTFTRDSSRPSPTGNI